MQIRCQRCGWSSNLSREFIQNAVQQADEQKLKHYPVECAKCRHDIKVSVQQLRRFVPRPAPET